MKKVTEEQKAKSVEKRERMRELGKKISEMSPEQREQLAAKAGIHTIEGRPLSSYNSCMLLAQSVGRVCPSIIGGFRQWKKADRFVMKGEHGYCIWIPKSKKESDPEDMPQDEEQGKTSFFLGTVFDISQTAAKELAEAA